MKWRFNFVRHSAALDIRLWVLKVTLCKGNGNAFDKFVQYSTAVNKTEKLEILLASNRNKDNFKKDVANLKTLRSNLYSVLKESLINCLKMRLRKNIINLAQ